MKLDFRSGSRTGLRVIIFGALLALAFNGSAAIGKEIPTLFNYRINPGVMIGKTAMTYVPLGKAYGIRYTVDNVGKSGPGQMIFNMYSDGTLVWTQPVQVSANGTFTRLEPAPFFLIGKKNYGPFYLCITAQTASGAKDVRPPCTKWNWIGIEVPIATVSNGCGGETGYKLLNETETGWLDKHMIDNLLFDFREACNVHDAGYSGVTVKDPIMNKVTDFSHWTRNAIDTLFQFEIQMICMKTISTSNVSDTRKASMSTTCNDWAARYYRAVRLVGKAFFDSNPVKAGAQLLYIDAPLLAGLPMGVGRNNS